MDSATRLLNNWDLVNRDLLLVSSCIIVHVRLASLERFHDQSQYGRRCVPVLSALELCINGSSRFNPGRGDCCVPCFTQRYEWGPVNLLQRLTLQWSSIPSRGKGIEIFLVAETSSNVRSS